MSWGSHLLFSYEVLVLGFGCELEIFVVAIISLWNWKQVCLKDFVKMFAGCSKVGRYCRLTSTSKTLSRTKWWWSLMCLVRAWKSWFRASFIAPLLSQLTGIVVFGNLKMIKSTHQKGIVSGFKKPNSWSIWRSQMASWVLSERAMYSLSVDERLTVDWRLLDHDNGSFASVNK